MLAAPATVAPVAAPSIPMPPPPMAAAVPPAAVATEIDPEAFHWKSYKDATGRAYYHDLRSNKTTYEMPLALKSLAERTLAPCKWKEYPSATGKPYFSDGVNSVWSEPAELTEYKARVAALNANSSSTTANPAAAAAAAVTPAAAAQSAGVEGTAAAAGIAQTSTAGIGDGTGKPGGGGRKRALPAYEAVVYHTAEERQAGFVNMLRECDITSQQKWGDVNRLCAEHPAWQALTSTGQRKQAFSEYQAKRMKEEKEERRTQQRKQRDLFLKMLATDTSIDVKTRWREASQRLSTDERYQSLEASVIDEREREEMFNEFVTELARKEDEEKKQQRGKRVEEFTDLLKELNENSASSSKAVTHAARWLDVRPLLEDASDPRFESMDENERKHVFADFVSGLRKTYDDEQKAKEKERRAEEKQRQADFKARLQDRVSEGTVTATSTWRDSKLELEKEPTYTALEEAGKTARQIFDDVVDGLQKAFRADRKYLRDLLDDATNKSFTGPPFKLSHETTFDGFTQALQSAEEVLLAKKAGTDEKSSKDGDSSKVAAGGGGRCVAEMVAAEPVSHARMFFDELIGREAVAYAEAQKKQRKLEERYTELLEDYYYRSDHVDTPWSDAKEDMRKRSAFLDTKEGDRRRMFDQHMTTLAKKLGTKSTKAAVTHEDKSSAKPDAEKSTGDTSTVGDDVAGTGKPKDMEDGEEKDEDVAADGGAAEASSSDSEDSEGGDKKKKETKKKSKKHSKDSKKKSSKTKDKDKDKEKKKRRSDGGSDKDDDNDGEKKRSSKRSKH